MAPARQNPRAVMDITTQHRPPSSCLLSCGHPSLFLGPALHVQGGLVRNDIYWMERLQSIAFIENVFVGIFAVFRRDLTASPRGGSVEMTGGSATGVEVEPLQRA